MTETRCVISNYNLFSIAISMVVGSVAMTMTVVYNLGIAACKESYDGLLIVLFVVGMLLIVTGIGLALRLSRVFRVRAANASQRPTDRHVYADTSEPRTDGQGLQGDPGV